MLEFLGGMRKSVVEMYDFKNATCLLTASVPTSPVEAISSPKSGSEPRSLL